MKAPIKLLRYAAWGTVCSACVVSIAFLLAGVLPAPKAVPVPIDLSAVIPGKQQELRVGAHGVWVAVPQGEGLSFGTMSIEIPNIGFASRGIERDGSLESVWIADVNHDASDDAVFVVRSVGSGSYASVVVLESDGATFRVRRLSEAFRAPGFMGHDQITILDGTIHRTFPTYVDREAARLDRQWSIEDGLAGELPLKRAPDSNSDPSGSSRELRYDYAVHAWKQG